MEWNDDEFTNNLNQTIDCLVEKGLLIKDGNQLQSAAEATESFDHLISLAQIVKPILLRYGILLTLLANQAGHRRTSRRELEKHSQQVAQRLAALYGLNAPESFDKYLFKTTIGVLKEANLIQIAEDNSFDISPKIEQLNQLILDNVSISSKRIMQKTTLWARKQWDDE